MNNNERSIVVACPNCGQKLEYNVMHVVDGSKDEYQKLAILNDKFFELDCGNCGHHMDMLYEFAYCDSDRGFSIYFVNEERTDGANVALQINQKIAEFRGEKPEVVRVTSSYADLIEKINIFDNGLDDRVVEIMKFFCIHHAIEHLSQLDVYDAHYCVHDGNHSFMLEGENGTAIASFPDGMYEQVERGFREMFDEHNCLIIDTDWAVHLIEIQESIDNDCDDNNSSKK